MCQMENGCKENGKKGPCIDSSGGEVCSKLSCLDVLVCGVHDTIPVNVVLMIQMRLHLRSISVLRSGISDSLSPSLKVHARNPPPLTCLKLQEKLHMASLGVWLWRLLVEKRRKEE
ncbi:hypothetical protein SAY87_000246 [Trapa incisa]|uniref:Uncharacterized protein n=1 Tax=Trapa incisa TaxID=236973 RepID=A0AAN7GGE8_9MYRT|nr:hypothetical protein SAY87_000246 [Trapa incisa]